MRPLLKLSDGFYLVKQQGIDEPKMYYLRFSTHHGEYADSYFAVSINDKHSTQHDIGGYLWDKRCSTFDSYGSIASAVLLGPTDVEYMKNNLYKFNRSRS